MMSVLALLVIGIVLVILIRVIHDNRQQWLSSQKKRPNFVDFLLYVSVFLFAISATAEVLAP